MRKQSPPLITPIDIVIIILLIGIGAASTLIFTRTTPREVIVYRDERLLARYSLDKDGTYSLEGKSGAFRIKVQEGAVSVVHSTCKNQICVRSRPIRRSGEHIICVPNHIAIEIPLEPGGKAFDAVIQ